MDIVPNRPNVRISKLFRRSRRQPAATALIRWKKLTKGGQNYVIRPSIRNDPLTLDGELQNMSESEAIPRDIRSKGTSEPWFQCKIDFRGCESVVKDNVVIPCLGMCSHCLREHFWHLIQAELCLRCSLNSLIRQL